MRLLKTLAAVAVLSAAAGFALRRSWPWPRLPAARPIVVSTAYHTLADTLRPGETLGDLFARQGLVRLDLGAVVRHWGLDPRRVRAGLVFAIRRPVGESEPDRVVVRAGDGVRLGLTRVGGEWRPSREPVRWTTELARSSGGIGTSLYAALDAHIADTELAPGERVRLAWDLADVFAWQVDFTRDLQVGDHFGVLFERRVSEEGEVRFGRILAAELTVSGKTLTAFRFDHAGATGYYDIEGRSLRRAFLRAPVEFRRITSRPSQARFHPVLQVYRRHAGTDYAAAPGTPVMAAGDGQVTYAGWSGGYGNLVELRHPNSVTTRYAHLQRIARGVRPGVRVSQGDVIGYVGSTGLSTGPHLHYEFLVRGVPRDPRQLVGLAGPPIAAALRPAFEQIRAGYLRLLRGDEGTSPLRPASALRVGD
jgi:murein DD-endopeptidase MepM/ murein hydrolase activator NlpD